MSARDRLPMIGISVGDLNGIGTEVIIKAFAEPAFMELCIPVIFGSSKALSFYRKALNLSNFNFNSVKSLDKAFPKAVNVINVWEEEVPIIPGEATQTSGKYAVKSFTAAMDALIKNEIDALVTAPLSKSNVKSDSYPFTGHTDYISSRFPNQQSLMMMVGEQLKVALVTVHIPIKEVAAKINSELIQRQLEVLHHALIRDFGISKPTIAVLGLNPHAGDNNLIGKEEEEIIKPALKATKAKNILVFGPYPADGFFANGNYKKFDAILAMYHDQGLIPFKYMSFDSGVNFTAGLPVIRTSPDHGTAFDIAGKNVANESSFRSAVFTAIDIINFRRDYDEMTKNPLKKSILTEESN